VLVGNNRASAAFVASKREMVTEIAMLWSVATRRRDGDQDEHAPDDWRHVTVKEGRHRHCGRGTAGRPSTPACDRDERRSQACDTVMPASLVRPLRWTMRRRRNSARQDALSTRPTAPNVRCGEGGDGSSIISTTAARDGHSRLSTQTKRRRFYRAFYCQISRLNVQPAGRLGCDRTRPLERYLTTPIQPGF
jgi:hypothetical protein